MSSGEKTEQATPKRKREQREKGNVLKSHDLSVALQLLGIFVVFKMVAPGIADGLQNIFYQMFPGQVFLSEQLTITATHGFGKTMILQGLLIMAPLFGIAFATAILANVLQSGLLLSSKTLAFKAERINPLSGLKRMFSSRSVMEMLKSIAKITIIIYTVYQQFMNDTRDFSGLLSYGVATAGGMIFDLAMALALRCGAVFLVLAGFDYLYQWWKFNKDLRMTKQEIKEEHKLSEGNPQTKGRIRQIQRMMANRRMMQDVPLADVIITNPTHFAIALRYDPELDAAPIVLAKGKNLIAARIKEIGRDNRVTIVENRPLAQSLYKMCKVGGLIPADLYQAVAEVLAYVFKLKGNKPKGGAR